MRCQSTQWGEITAQLAAISGTLVYPERCQLPLQKVPHIYYIKTDGLTWRSQVP